MNNTRFATLIHILTLLAKHPEEWISSEWISGSIGINPAVVRKELSFLQEKGWVVSKKGKEGGSKLNKSSCDISLGELYLGVKNSTVLGKKNASTAVNCSVGKQINKELEELFNETDQLVLKALEKKSLKAFVAQFK